MTLSAGLQPLIKQLEDIKLVSSIESLLHWDQETHMPDSAIDHRALQQSFCAKYVHQQCVSDEFKQCLATFVDLDSGNLLVNNLCFEEQRLVQEVHKDWQQWVALPTEFVAQFAQLTSKATHVWQQARQESNYKLFQPYLDQIIEFNRQKAGYIAGDKPVYDVLLNEYEPGLTQQATQRLFDELKQACLPLLEAVKTTSLDFKSLKGPFAEQAQWDYTLELLTLMGFDFTKGKQDKSTHPFTIDIHPNDVRVTTRIKSTDLFEAITSTVHEGGHALYEQGFLSQYYATPLAESVSLGIHESQSRFWENHVCKTLAFWTGQWDKLIQKFPAAFSAVTPNDVYKQLNQVNPGPIRVEADELTYIFHVMIRFECEQALFNQTISTDQLPEFWNSLYQKYLGITPKNDTCGVLQDIHWAGGSFGYFPTYVIGSVCAAQLHATIKTEFPSFDEMVFKGEWLDIKQWLGQEIHQQGRCYMPDDLIKKVTGKPITTAFFIDYLYDKYQSLYGIKL